MRLRLPTREVTASAMVAEQDETQEEDNARYADELCPDCNASMKDGTCAACGYSVTAAGFTSEQRAELAKNGEAMPDGSFPIRDRSDLQNAVQSVGRAADPDKAKRWIVKRARELDAVDALPEDWNVTAAFGGFDEAKHPRVQRGQHGGGRFTVKENAAGRFEVVNPQGTKVAETTDAADAQTVADEKNAMTESRVVVTPDVAAEQQDYQNVLDQARTLGIQTSLDDPSSPPTVDALRARIRETLGVNLNDYVEVSPGVFLHRDGSHSVSIDPSSPTGSRRDQLNLGAAAAWTVVDEEPCQECIDIVASIPVKPPDEWFDLEEPDHPVPITVTSDGQIYGHAALWGTCHLGNPRGAGVCVTPPVSKTDYGLFHLGEIETASGARVPVGGITLDTGHAPIGASARTAAAHYDDTGTVVADVRARNGKHGVWYSGALRPDITPVKVRALTAAKISGDWRGGEMVGMLAVNVPGFPVPRAQARLLASADGQEEVLALVAAGIFGEEPPSLQDLEVRASILVARAEGGIDGLLALALGDHDDLTAGIELTIRVDDAPTVEVPVIVDREKIVTVPGETVVVDREKLVPVNVPGETVVVEQERVTVVEKVVPQIVTQEKVKVVPQVTERHTVERITGEVAGGSSSGTVGMDELTAASVPRSYDQEIALEVDFYGTHGYWPATPLSGRQFGMDELMVIRAAAEMVSTATSVQGGLLRDRLSAEGYLR